MKHEKDKMPLDKTIRNKILERAIEVNRQCPDDCYDFRIMASPMREDALIMRWTTINIENIENPIQCFRYQCFHLDGSPQNCSVYYTNQQEANAFFYGLITLYRQQFAHDHVIR